MNLHELYDGVATLVAKLEQDHDIPGMPVPDYRKVKALAAGYELMDYLSNTIAEEVAAGRLMDEEEYEFTLLMKELAERATEEIMAEQERWENDPSFPE